MVLVSELIVRGKLYPNPLCEHVYAFNGNEMAPTFVFFET